jgi:hypothetical protein
MRMLRRVLSSPPLTVSTSFLEALLGAVPNEQLRPLMLAFLTGRLPNAPQPADGPPQEPAPCRKRGRPAAVNAAAIAREKRRLANQRSNAVRRAKRASASAQQESKEGRPPARVSDPVPEDSTLPEILPAAAKPSEIVDAMVDTAAAAALCRREAKRVAANQYRREWRARRAAAKVAAEEESPAGRESTPARESGNGADGARRFWAKAKALAPAQPWRAVSRRLDLNEAVCLDHYRNRTLPPGLEPGAVEMFLQLPVS